MAWPIIGNALDTLLKLTLELYRAAKETPAEEFQELAMSMIRVQLSFRTAMWGTCETTDAGLVLNSVHLHNEPLEILQDWASIHVRDPMVDKVIANPGCAQICYTPEVYCGTSAMLDFTHRYGHTNSMIIAELGRGLRHGNVHVEWLALYRAEKHAHFGQADQLIVEQLMPHLAEALAINRMLGAGQSVHADSGLAGTRAFIRQDGTLYHCGKKFAELLREVWPELKDGRLPSELMTRLVPGKEIMLPGQNIAVSTAALGNMLLLSIRRVSPLSKLTQRELAVARLFGQGNSHKEIAQRLDIAPSTVRNFLSGVYRKLNISSKAELASLTHEG
jgi:DNA-binding CsgD family transcriptional regulator